jgi:hypothetical protein
VVYVSEPLEPPPTSTAAERAAQVLIASASEVPIAGTIVTALVQIFGASYQVRLDDWNRHLWAAVIELQERDVLADAMQRPEWLTAVHDATRIALGEHLEEKLDMLQAILINVATHAPERAADSLALRYLRWIDELEPEHIALLRGAGLDGAFAAVDSFDELAPDAMDRRVMLVEDLQSRGLLTSNLPARLMVDEKVYLLAETGPTSRREEADGVTDRGRRFLDWLAVM